MPDLKISVTPSKAAAVQSAPGQSAATGSEAPAEAAGFAALLSARVGALIDPSGGEGSNGSGPAGGGKHARQPADTVDAPLVPGLAMAEPLPASVPASLAGQSASTNPAGPLVSDPQGNGPFLPGSSLQQSNASLDSAALSVPHGQQPAVTTSITARSDEQAIAGSSVHRADPLAGGRLVQPAPEGPQTPAAASATSAQQLGAVAPNALLKPEVAQSPQAHSPTPVAGDAAPAIPVQSAPAQTSPVQLQLATPLSSPNWIHEFAKTVAVSIKGGVHTAEIQIEPRDLGPISLSVTVNGNSASVSMVAASGDTRALLQSSLPQLRDILQASGIQLSGASVHSGGSDQRGQSGYSGRAYTAQQPASAPVPAVGSVSAASPSQLPATRRLVDTFA